MCDVERKISEASTVLEKLLKRRNDLKTAINQKHDSISRRVPPEIASTIFQFYVKDRSDLLWSEPEDLANPLILGAVCHAWHVIAWSTPQLWTTISLRFDFPESKISTLVQLAQQGLDRTGQLPLLIAFRTESDIPIETLKKYTALCPMIDSLSSAIPVGIIYP